MLNRFEELEYLADYIPDEGEAVVVTRRNGELICEPARGDVREVSEPPSISLDPQLYGRLVQANERLNAVGAWPIFASVTVWFWSCVAVHVLSGLGWHAWFLHVGLALPVAFGCHLWIRRRQERLFRTEIRPIVARLLHERDVDRYVVLGAMRQRPELRTLLDDMARWID
jgi:hypothetical protein